MIYLILLTCFLLRALPRLRLKNTFVSDTYYHLFCAATIRENKFCLPKKLPRIILPHRYTYPFLYHLLLACFPLRWRLWVERLTGAFFDTASLVVIYIFSVWAVRQTAQANPNLQNLPLLVAVLYAFSPALLRIGSGPRAYNGSPRTMGQWLYLLHLLSAYYAYTTASFPGLLVSLLAGATVIVTAKFGSQVLVFFGLFFAALVSYQYIFLLAGCFLLALVLTRGWAWAVLQGHLRHSVFYFKNLQQVFLYPHTISYQRWISQALNSVRGLIRQGKYKEFIQWYYQERYFVHLLLTVYPQFLLLAYYLIPRVITSDLHHFLGVWTTASFIWFLVTKTRSLLFLGEGERYLEYALFPSLYLAVAQLTGNWLILVYLFLGYSILFAGYSVLQYYEIYTPINQRFESLKAAYTRLNEGEPGIIMPIGSFHWQALYHARFSILTIGGNIDETLLSKDEFMLTYGHYPYPSAHFREIVDRYNVAYIVSDAAHLVHYRNNILKEPQDFDQQVELIEESPVLIIGRVGLEKRS